MFRIFSRKGISCKPPRKGRNQKNASGKVNKSPSKPIGPSQRQIAEDMLKKMPPPPDFVGAVADIVYKKDFSEIRVDILRLIRRVEIIKRAPGAENQRILLGSMVDVPEDIKEGPKEGVFLFMKLLEELINHFESDNDAQELIDKMHEKYNQYLLKVRKAHNDVDQKEASDSRLDLLEHSGNSPSDGVVVDVSHIVDHKPSIPLEEETEDSGNFTVKSLVEAIGGDMTRSGLAVRCMCQGVAVSGHIQVKTRVCPLPTHDFHGERGWRVSIILAEFVQIKHTRREKSMQMMPNSNRNSWEIEFDVHLTFAKNMSEISAVKLSISELLLSKTMDQELATYLKEKFNNGKLIVC